MRTAMILLITMSLASGLLYGAADEQPPAVPTEEQPEVLTRGPVHEAFAEPVNLEAQSGIVAPIEPPANIVENPPEQRPSGSQFVWVPGYWAWDSDRTNYIWISGCWRAVPPNKCWVPGYWSQTTAGWEWIAGFWAPVANSQQIEYLPAPPAMDDTQPPGPPPIVNDIWTPPCWYWYQGQYVRRSGYWLTAREDWIWMPSHYAWTPRGCVFVAGYWDYPLRSRGVLFAPFYIPRHSWERPGFSLSLGVVVDFGMLQFNLFTYPRYHHYYFGDYYDDAYINIGIFPWFECRDHHTWYDPIYEHDRWRNRKIRPDWDAYERHEYDLRRTDRELRPPRTYREMEIRQAKMPEGRRKDIQIARPISRIIADKREPFKFETIKTDARQKLSRQTSDVHKFKDQRSLWESSRSGSQTIQPPMEHQSPVTSTTERRGQVTSPTERKGPMSPASDRRGSVSPPTERKPLEVPQREVKLTQPDRVKIPSSPISDRAKGLSFFKKGPPSRPSDEQKADVRDTQRDKDSGTGRGRDRK